MQPFISLRNIVKTYGAVRALRDVSLDVMPGEVLGLIGENGAGKSTLMKVIGGVIPPTSGSIVLGGRTLSDLSVRQSIEAGIAFVHQELNLFDNLDVAANIFIGREPLRGGPLRLVDSRRMREQVRPYLERLGCTFAPDTPVGALSIAQRQMLEIAKALSMDARLIIMDEPTSSLTASETTRLLEVVAGLSQAGVGVVFITHRLNEIERCADRVVALRDGIVAGEIEPGRIDRETMIRLMIGRDLKSVYDPPAGPRGPALLSVSGVTSAAHPQGGVDLEIHRGEILGLSGLIGAGRSELARIMFGIDRGKRGSMTFDGASFEPQSAAQAIAKGIYLVPEDRKGSGLLLDMSIAENISLADLKRRQSRGLVDSAAENRTAEEQRASLRIKCLSVHVPAGTLSGGNQQKVVLAKWLSMNPKLMILDEPTRGVDVASKSEIYGIMRALADRGLAVLMISSDMEEVIGVSDRVAIMHEGSVSGILQRADLSEQNIMRLAVGGTHKEGSP